ncbi:M20 family metallopeptidase [Pseudomonadota bacterium]
MELFKTKKEVRDHLVQLTKDLVRFPSHEDEPLKIFEALGYIRSYFEGDKLHFAGHTMNGYPALVVTTEATKHPHVMLSGHIDVVSSGAKFEAEEVEDDYLAGTGTMDMKGGLACMMAVMKFYAQKKERAPLGLMITSDEEIGGESTKTLLEDEGYSADYCIVNEGRGKYEIVVREKELLLLKIKLSGESIHSAYPWKGRNVLEAIMKVCMEVKRHFPRQREGWVPTVTVTSMQAGKEHNTIPADAEAVLCFRLTGVKKWSKENVIRLVKSKAKDLEVTELVHGNVFETNPREKHTQLLRKTVQDVTGKPVKFAENHGASDARHFSNKGIETSVLGPAGKDHHTAAEMVSIQSLVTHFEVLKRFVAHDYEMFKPQAADLIKKNKGKK